MLESFIDRDGLDKPVPFRTGRGFIDIVEGEFLALLPVVMMKCPQTGEITKERGSGQAAKDENGMLSLELLPESETTSRGIECVDIRNRTAGRGTLSAPPLRSLRSCPWTRD